MGTDKNIILIDDNLVDLFIHERIVKKCYPKANVTLFSDPKYALKYFKTFELQWQLNKEDAPNVIFIDINMPSMSGFELLKELENTRIFEEREVKIYILTTSTNIVDINMSKKCSLCSGYILKPLVSEKLQEVLIPQLSEKYLLKI